MPPVSVTPAMIEAEIAATHYIVPRDVAPAALASVGLIEDTTTFCRLTLQNGFTVYGKSACADPQKFDRALGGRYALEDAKNKVWELLGFRLRDELAKLAEARPLAGRVAEMGGETYIGRKVIHAVPMTRLAYNELRGWTLPADENGSDAGYLVQYADQDQVNVEGFTGYVSWSPADVFDEAYKKVGGDGKADDKSA